jgi:hypothetical protein
MQWLRAAEALHDAKDLAVAEPPVDPAHMPSDGLLRAAQYAYPFNLFELTPWVDPRVRDLLVTPQEQPATFLLLARALTRAQPATIELKPRLVQLRGEVLVQLAGNREGAVNTLSADELTIEFLPEADASADVLVEKVEGETADAVTIEGQLVRRWHRVAPPAPPDVPPAPEKPDAEEQPETAEPAPAPQPPLAPEQ